MPIKIERWIEKSGIDYYMSFIKAWIPFNAWYMSEYYDEDAKLTSDSAIIDKIKKEDNQFKQKIRSLITTSGEDSEEFKKHLYHLQKSLEAHPLSKGDSLSFDRICIFLNTEKNITFTSGKKTYKGIYDITKRRTDNRFSVEAMRPDGRTIVKIEVQNCKEETLTAHPDFAKCSDKEKENLKKCLSAIFPKKPISIISPDPKKGIHIYGDLYMVKDVNLIAQGIITMFYELRCKLFHGELDPTDSNSSIYRHAYHMLYLLIKELK